MEWAVVKMEAQLERWSLRIDDLVAKIQLAGRPADFDALTYIDELKALHAIARARLTEYKASVSPRRIGLEAETKRAWQDLHAAFENLAP